MVAKTSTVFCGFAWSTFFLKNSIVPLIVRNAPVYKTAIRIRVVEFV